MKKQLIKGTAAALVVASSMALGAVGASYLQEINAYINYGITVKYDGQEQHMYDANGQRVYPISYNGTTYVPIRAVGNMMGINVAWDGTNNTVLLGKTGMAIDFIETIQPYSVKNPAGYTGYVKHITSKDYASLEIAGNVYDHYIEIADGKGLGCFYDLSGKYEQLTFKVYSEHDITIGVYGDNEELLQKITAKANSLPAEYKIDVSEVQQLSILTISDTSKFKKVYILDATIE